MRLFGKNCTEWARSAWNDRIRSRAGFHAQWVNRRHGFFAVDLDSFVGFFAHMVAFLGVCSFCDRRGLIPLLKATGEQYLDPNRGDNWYEYFYQTPDCPIPRVHYWKVNGIRVLNNGLPLDREPWTLPRASRLIEKYMPLKPSIQSEIEEIYSKLFRGKSVLGLHFRGTDKKAEAVRVEYDQALAKIRRVLRSGNFNAIYASSDELAFLTFLRKALPDTEILIRNDRERSRTGQSIHNSLTGDRYAKGKDAVINAYLLARCNGLIKTSSLLSAWSLLLNPSMPVWMMNVPKPECLWFPERDIVLGDYPHYRII